MLSFSARTRAGECAAENLFSLPVYKARPNTYTGANLIAEYEKDFLEFLNGFVIDPT